MSDNGEDIISVGAEVDVRALMEEIRADIRRKRDAGEYPADVLLQLPLQRDSQEAADDALTSALAELKRSANFTSQVTVASKRPFIGPVVSKARQIIRASLTWYFNGILAQIRSFSGNVERSMAIVAEHTTRLGGRLAALEKGVEGVAQRLDGLDRAARELEGSEEQARK